MEQLESFIKSQRVLTLATKDWSKPWISNVYYWYQDGVFYFISLVDAQHSQQILQNNSIAFSTVRYNKSDHTDRKSLQWTGICKQATDEKSIALWVWLHNHYFPQFAERITVGRVLEDVNRAVWMILPNTIKFWNDELYWINGTCIFDFS